MDLATAFGIILKQKREALKLSQEELSFEAGLHRTYISLLERGLKSPTIDVIFRLSSALNILPSHFIAEVERLINTISS